MVYNCHSDHVCDLNVEVSLCVTLKVADALSIKVCYYEKCMHEFVC